MGAHDSAHPPQNSHFKEKQFDNIYQTVQS